MSEIFKTHQDAVHSVRPKVLSALQEMAKTDGLGETFYRLSSSGRIEAGERGPEIFIDTKEDRYWDPEAENPKYPSSRGAHRIRWEAAALILTFPYWAKGYRTARYPMGKEGFNLQKLHARVVEFKQATDARREHEAEVKAGKDAWVKDTVAACCEAGVIEYPEEDRHRVLVGFAGAGELSVACVLTPDNWTKGSTRIEISTSLPREALVAFLKELHGAVLAAEDKLPDTPEDTPEE